MSNSQNYEQYILDLHSTARLRRAVLDNPPEPEVPWHEYPVPTHMAMDEVNSPWIPYTPGIVYHSLKYSDGSQWDQRNKWRYK